MENFSVSVLQCERFENYLKPRADIANGFVTASEL